MAEVATSVELAEELRQRIQRGIWKPGHRLPTEREMATEFGVCQTTVKKAVIELKREGLIDTHQGRGRYVAESATRSKTWTIGAVLFDLEHITHPVLSQTIQGVQTVLAETDYHLTIFALNSRSAKRSTDTSPDHWLGLVDTRGVDGVIVLARQVSPEQIEDLMQVVPVCTKYSYNQAGRAACVRVDTLSGAFATAEHLVRTGHRRIAQVTVGPTASVSWEQREGMRLGMMQTTGGNKVECHTLVAQAFSVEEGKRVVAKALAQGLRPDAIAPGSDELALGAYQALTEASLSMPQDVSLMGWNDVLTTDDIPVPLTTIRPDWKGLGQHGIRKLIELIEKPDQTPEETILASELIVRDSTPRR